MLLRLLNRRTLNNRPLTAQHTLSVIKQGLQTIAFGRHGHRGKLASRQLEEFFERVGKMLLACLAQRHCELVV